MGGSWEQVACRFCPRVNESAHALCSKFGLVATSESFAVEIFQGSEEMSLLSYMNYSIYRNYGILFLYIPVLKFNKEGFLRGFAMLLSFTCYFKLNFKFICAAGFFARAWNRSGKNWVRMWSNFWELRGRLCKAWAPPLMTTCGPMQSSGQSLSLRYPTAIHSNQQLESLLLPERSNT